MMLTLVACVACNPDRTDQNAALVTSSDPGLARAAARLLPDLADRAGLELLEPVRLERRTRGELERYLQFKLDEELPADQAELLTESYGLLGMVPRDMDLRAVLKGLYLEQVAGFYDPDSTTLFVLDDQPEDALESLLVHELVHAIQDQSTDLDAITDPDLGNDRQVAAQAAIEGHATLVMFEFLMGLQGGAVDLTEMTNFTDLVRPALEAARTQSPALAGAPLVLQESLLFPYLGGASFVEALWKEEPGRPPPFGSRLPTSTEHILHPERFLGDEPDSPVTVELQTPARWTWLYDDSLGEMETGILLEIHTGSRAPAEGWDGDRYLLLEDEDGVRALVWVSVWDSEGRRDVFLAALEQQVGGFPVQASVGAMDVSGRPGVRLVIGNAGGVEASLAGPEGS
jgi:hypothetical protein